MESDERAMRWRRALLSIIIGPWLACCAPSQFVTAPRHAAPADDAQHQAATTATTHGQDMQRFSQTFEELLDSLATEGIPGNDQLISLHQDPALRSELIARFHDVDAAMQPALLELMIELGRPIIPAQGDIPRRLGPIVDQLDMIEFFISCLGHPTLELRKTAAEALALLTPADALAAYCKKIVAHIAKYPDTENAVRVIGKCPGDPSRELILHEPRLTQASPDDAIMVRARLGDTAAQQALLDAYADAAGPGEKAALALRLGYSATPQAISLLATQLRSPEAYIWNQQSRRSLRIHIIAGLHEAFPREALLWPPFFDPEDDSYYEQIEQWAETTLGQTWHRPRPPFLYQESAPTGR